MANRGIFDMVEGEDFEIGVFESRSAGGLHARPSIRDL